MSSGLSGQFWAPAAVLFLWSVALACSRTFYLILKFLYFLEAGLVPLVRNSLLGYIQSVAQVGFDFAAVLLGAALPSWRECQGKHFWREEGGEVETG